jgi:protein tyrosine kinase modulator
MLQNDRSQMQPPYDVDEQGLDPSHYFEILKKRKFYILIPFILVAAIGSAVVMLWPPTYLSEGKILVESQQIPTDLVRPTVTTTARERLQVIEQRVMTRDNVLAIMDKYQIFADRRDTLSRTELLDLMRENIRIKSVDVDQLRARENRTTIALTVGFTNRRPDIATKVANDLITLFLNEDARNRTNRAMETTKFLAREVQRLETELGSIENKISELKRQQRSAPLPEGGVAAQNPQLAVLATLKAELAGKSAIYSKSHPEIKRLKGQIEAIEKTNLSAPPSEPARTAGLGPQVDPAVLDALDALITQRKSIQDNLDEAAKKFSAARLGENLERDQFSERLEVLEQAIMPQKPIKPDRPKLLALAFVAAVMAGFAGVFAVETFDRTIRGSRDLLKVVDGNLLVAIPYISTRAELRRKKSKIALVTLISIVVVLGALAAVHFLLRPLDEVWEIFVNRLIVLRPPSG